MGDKMSTEGQESAQSRRRFIAAIAGAIGAALAAASLWPVWEFLSPPERPGEGKETAVVPRAKVGLGEAYFFQFEGHPSVVLQNSPGIYVALSAVCTHLGCIVEWRPKQRIFFCPCHAGRFSPAGQVLGGPPPRPLPLYPVRVEKERLIIG